MAAFFVHVGSYLDQERPAEAGTGKDDGGTDRVFVCLKRPRRGRPLTASGVEEVLDGAATALVLPGRPVTSCATPA